MTQRTRFFKAGLPFFMATLVGCQPPRTADSGTAAAAETPSSPVPHGFRQDGSSVSALDNNIERSTGPMIPTRQIPHLKDSAVSYCESVSGKAGGYNGVRDLSPYPLASLSKIFLSAWALDRLGPDFRFVGEWHLRAVTGQPGLFDGYFRANYDPAVNIEKMLYAMAKLRTAGVMRLRRLVIDQSTRVYLSVLNNPHVELDQVPVNLDQSLENLRLILNSSNWGSQTQLARQRLQKHLNGKGEPLIIPDSFQVQDVSYVPSQQIETASYPQKIKISSSLLLKYVKEINTNSNNYLADALFSYLGGAQEFKKFQTARLNVAEKNLQMNTGSGLPVVLLGHRTDNLGTCHAILKTLKFVNEMSKISGFDLGHVFLTGGTDVDGTFEPTLPLDFQRGVVMKTGRLYDVPALNVAGVVALQQDLLFFAFMAHDFNNEQELIYKKKRDEILRGVLSYFPVQPTFQSLSLDTIFFN